MFKSEVYPPGQTAQTNHNTNPGLGLPPDFGFQFLENKDNLYSSSASGEKLECLGRYPLVFNSIDTSTLKIIPILTPRKELHTLMERIYDKQHEILQKKKSIACLNIPNAIHELLLETLNINQQHFIQSIGNLIYSAEKYSTRYEEVQFFLKCNQAGFDSYQLLFYLFVRQHFKVLTYTCFKSHRKNNKDPLDIKLSNKDALEIIKVAFDSEPTSLKTLNEEITKLYVEKPDSGFYNFMIKCVNCKINYKDIALLDKLTALYVVDYEEQLQKNLRRQILKTKVHKKDDKLLNEHKTESIEENNQLVKAKTGVSVGANPENQIGSNPKINTELNQSKTTNPEKEQIPSGQSKISQLKAKLAETTQPIVHKKIQIANQGLISYYSAIKNEVSRISMRIILTFPPSKKINNKIVGDRTTVIGGLIDHKLNSLIDCVFRNESRKFSKLLRDDYQLNVEITKLWKNMSVDLTRKDLLENVTEKDVFDFLDRLIEFPLIKQQIEFLINFQLKNEKDILNVQTSNKVIDKFK